MKLNAEILFYELSQNFFCQAFGDFTKAALFSHAEPLSRDAEPRPGVLYVCAPGDLDEGMKEGAYVCAGRPRSIPKTPGVFLLSVEGVGSEELFRRLTAIFCKYTDWDNALLAALSGPEPLRAMVKCSELLFKNPLSVMGCNFHMLVPPPDAIEDYISRYTSPVDESGYLPLNVVNYFKQDPYYNAISSKRGAFSYTSELLPFQNLCVNLFKDNEFIARIIIFEIYNLFRPFDGFLLEHLARYMGPCFSFSATELLPDPRGLQGFLRSVLEGGDGAPADSALSARGWSPKDSFLWLHLLQTEHDVNIKTAYYTCVQIERLFPQTCALQHAGGICVLINLTAAQKTPEEFLGEFEPFSQKGGFRTGASNCFTGAGALAEIHRQASIAAVTGRKKAPDRWLYRFTDVAVHYLLRNGVRDLPVLLCCHPAVQRLAAYDAENATDYIKTLGHYLDNQMNIIETARQLFIHRSTMIYRLGRIKELTGVDWTDKDLIFYLILSLKLLNEDLASQEKTPMRRPGQDEALGGN